MKSSCAIEGEPAAVRAPLEFSLGADDCARIRAELFAEGSGARRRFAFGTGSLLTLALVASHFWSPHGLVVDAVAAASALAALATRHVFDLRRLAFIRPQHAQVHYDRYALEIIETVGAGRANQFTIPGSTISALRMLTGALVIEARHSFVIGTRDLHAGGWNIVDTIAGSEL